MNLSRRNEAFRYQFSEPMEAKFRLTELNGKKIDSRMGKMNILDMSLRGLKISMSLDLPVDDEKINGLFYFNIAAVEYIIPGKFVWRKPAGQDIHYGVYLQCDERTKKALVTGLKAHVRSKKAESAE